MSERSLAIAIAHGNDDSRQRLYAAVLQLGHTVVIHAPSGAELISQARAQQPELIIVQEFLPDTLGLLAAEQASSGNAVPTIVVISRNNGQLLEQPQAGYVFAVLQEPVRHCDLAAVIPLARQQYARLQALYAEHEQLRRELGSYEESDGGADC